MHGYANCLCYDGVMDKSYTSTSAKSTDIQVHLPCSVATHTHTHTHTQYYIYSTIDTLHCNYLSCMISANDIAIASHTQAT